MISNARDDQDGRAREQIDPGEVREPRDSGEAASASDRVDVQNEDPDDLAETESDDRQVITAEPQRWNSHEESGNRGAGRPDGERDEQQDTVLKRGREHADPSPDPVAERRGHVGRDVGPDRHESGVADRKLPGEAVDQVQAHGEDDVDPGERNNLEEIRGD